MTIQRIWHGWTTPDKAEAYRTLLNQEIRPEIEAKNLTGYRGLQLLCRDLGEEIEFMTIITFDSLQDVIAFQGTDYERCYVPESAQAVLSRWDKVCLHYETVPPRR